MKKRFLISGFACAMSLSTLFVSNDNASAQEAAESKLNLRSNSLLRVPVNIPQERIYDSGISIPYPADGVKESIYRPLELKVKS